MDYLSFVLCLLLAWVAIHLLISTTRKNHDDKSNPKRLPPGPHAIPIIGNLPSLANNPHSALAKLAKTYGPLMLVHLGQIPTVVISSAVMAKETLQKNDQYVSNRTIIDAVRALNHHERSVVWLPPGPLWHNLYRICMSRVFSVSSLDGSQSVRCKVVKDLISDVQKSSEAGTVMDLGQVASDNILNLLTSTLFSLDLNDPSSEYAQIVKQCVRGIMDEAGKPNLSDYFPVMRKIDPLRIRRRMGVHFHRMIDLFNTNISQRLKGKGPSSGLDQPGDALDALLGAGDEIAQSDIPRLLTDLLAAGADSTSSSLVWAMAELLHNPDKLKKAQEELRDVIGEGNAVSEVDIGRLPYLQAVIKETLRLHPAVPLSVPRRADKDVSVFGFTVPKNAQMLVNIWAIGRDPDVWERPDSFEPERFLGSKIGVDGRDFELIPFGAGSRVCPGWDMAVRMIHLMVAALVHGFDWKLEGRVSVQEMDMEEKLKFTLEKAERLRAIPVRV